MQPTISCGLFKRMIFTSTPVKINCRTIPLKKKQHRNYLLLNGKLECCVIYLTFNSSLPKSIASRLDIHVGSQSTLQPSVRRQMRTCDLFDLVKFVKSTARCMSVTCSAKTRSDALKRNDNRNYANNERMYFLLRRSNLQKSYLQSVPPEPPQSNLPDCVRLAEPQLSTILT